MALKEISQYNGGLKIKKVFGCIYRNSIPAGETKSSDLFKPFYQAFCFSGNPCKPTLYLVVDRHKQENFRMT